LAFINICDRTPQIHTLPDVLTLTEVERLILATRQLRYQVFLLTTYSMGLRLSEALALQVGDIDAQFKQVHIRRGKGHKDRFVPLPDLTYHALRSLWASSNNRIRLWFATLTQSILIRWVGMPIKAFAKIATPRPFSRFSATVLQPYLQYPDFIT
jgi:integrase